MTDRDFWQDRRVDRIAGELQQQHLTADAATSDILGSLRRELELQKSELLRQSLAIGVLTELLIERGAVGRGQLQALFDRKMAALVEDAKLVPCARCKARVDRSVTMMTGTGPMCPACYQAVNADE